MNSALRQVQKLCIVSIHDDSVKDAVLFNGEKFVELNLQAGDIVKIAPLRHHDDNQREGSGDRENGENLDSATASLPGPFSTITVDEKGADLNSNPETDNERAYLFTVTSATPDPKLKNANTALSISQSVANAFGFRKWSQVIVSRTHDEVHYASHVELTFREEYISRGDMWCMVTSELNQKMLFKDQKLLFLDSIKATVKNIYIHGEKQKYGFFGPNTRPIFRSESARFVLFIQMSKEMWDFDVEGGSEIMFNKVINGFLPELFKGWASIQARHLVTIVLFSRVVYDENEVGLSLSPSDDKQGPRAGSKDFYRVVVNDMSSNDWIRILHQLKTEFTTFLRDILTFTRGDDSQSGSPLDEQAQPSKIMGKITPASMGNILEAISLASSQFSRDWVDRDLTRTGISVIVITAGSGVYEVDYRLLKFITDILIKGGIGIDLVCLAPMPLHSVPLFKYRSPKTLDAEPSFHSAPLSFSTDNTPRQNDISALFASRILYQHEKSLDPTPGDWSFAIPHWIDVSFWKGIIDEHAATIPSHETRVADKRETATFGKPFSIRCVLYELEMMGLMEQELVSLGITNLYEHPLHPWHKMRHRITGRPSSEIDRPGIAKMDVEWMKRYDDNIFQPLQKRKATEDAARKRIRAPEPDTLAPVEAGLERPPKTTNARGGYLEWSINDKSSEKKGNPRRKSSILSLVSMSDRESVLSRTSGVSRHISLGTIAPPQGDFNQAVADKASSSGSSKSETEKPPAASKYLEQFKSTLFRAAGAKPVPKAPSIEQPKIVEEAPESPKEPPIQIANEPSKPIDIGPSKLASHARTSSDERYGSLETVKGRSGSPKKNSLDLRPEDSAILFAASSSRRTMLRTNLSPIATSSAFPETLSPIKALAPWLVLVNPSNPRKNNWNINAQFRRWQHVFPKQLKVSAMKWKSLSSPASVPLTNEFFPTEEQFAKEYQEGSYKITVNPDEDLPEVPKTRDALVRELISLRLASGFQVIVGAEVAEFMGKTEDDLNIFEKTYMSKEGDAVYMSIGNIIHRIQCISVREVEVRRYVRRPAAKIKITEGYNTLNYRPYIRGASSASYERREVLFRPPKAEANWNFVDHWIAGYEEGLSETLEFWRARYVFIPMDLPTPQKRRNLQPVLEDSEEEIRLEGIKKLTHIWQRHRVLPLDETKHQTGYRRVDTIPPHIEYQTRDPSAVIAAGVDGLLLEIDPSKPGEFDFSVDNFDLRKLALELQGENGIAMMDRRWHFRKHENCFVGADLVSWLVQRFQDVREREEAESFGGELMEKGLFQHVHHKHRFRDGQFFYQITKEYITQRERGWFGSTKRDREKSTVPSTPVPETPRHHSESTKSRPTTSSSSDGDEKLADSEMPLKKRTIRLSGAMRYNVDPKKQSYRPEIITLHYDRLHSPDNCYHFRIEWLNVTSKLIEDCLSQWALHGRKYGLRLVQMPIMEAAKIAEDHPFRATYLVRLALQPPDFSATYDLAAMAMHSSTSTAPRWMYSDPFTGHKAILKHLNFVLDVESTKSFPPDVDIEYSWGRYNYRFTQYVHRSGVVIAQISDDGDFLLFANRLYNERYISNVVETTSTTNPTSIINTNVPRDRMHSGNSPTPLRPASNSPAGSPSSRPVAESGQGHRPANIEDIRHEVDAFCSDEKALRLFYADLNKAKPSPGLSPLATPARGPLSTAIGLPALGEVPNLRLPPRPGLAVLKAAENIDGAVKESEDDATSEISSAF